MCVRKSTTARLLMLGCAGLFCVGGSYTWDPGGSNFFWDDYGNWDSTSFTYPGTTDDDATVPEDGREWNGDPEQFKILLVTEEIDDLLIEEDADFQYKTGETGTQTLTCDSIEIYGNGADVTVRLGVGGDVQLVTN